MSKRLRKIREIILKANWRRAKKNYKCCFKHKNQLTIVEGWSYLCKKCLRYTFDYSENQYILDRKSKKELKKLIYDQKPKENN